MKKFNRLSIVVIILIALNFVGATTIAGLVIPYFFYLYTGLIVALSLISIQQIFTRKEGGISFSIIGILYGSLVLLVYIKGFSIFQFININTCNIINCSNKDTYAFIIFVIVVVCVISAIALAIKSSRNKI